VVLATAVTIVLWASSFPATRYALASYSPLALVLLRLCSGSAVLAVCSLAAGIRLPARRDLPALLVFGFVGIGLASAALTTGLRDVSAGAGSFLVGTIPVFSALLARFWFKERLSWLGWAAIATSMAGVTLIALGESSGFRINWGAAWIVASALCQSIYYVGQKPLLRRYSALHLTAYALFAGTFLLLPFLGRLATEFRAAPWRATAAGIYLGTFPVAVAFVTWSYALSRAKVGHVTSAMYAMPAIALTIAYFWLGEVPHPLSIVGGGIALAGVATLAIWGR